MSTTQTPPEDAGAADTGAEPAAPDPGGPDPAPDPTEAGERPTTDRVVLGASALIVLAIVLWGVLGTKSLANAADSALAWVVNSFGWFFILSASGFVLFALWLAFSRYGRVPLGDDGERPEFRTVSWVAMMFSAGMGIGLMFYGVAEPLTHFTAPPPGTVQPGAPDAGETAMATTLFHWTLHPWAMYAVVGLAIAYSSYRRGRSQLLSSAFAPLLGTSRSSTLGGKVIDILAVFATLFGSAASLGLGALQIGTGLDAIGALRNPGTGLLILIIAVLTVAFVASAVSGVAKGIQWLSNINMVLAVILAVFVFVVGPTVLILNLIPTSVGSYIRDLAAMSARTAASGEAATKTWLADWTVFYWAWWISWTPFVGMFIARISRGRTIRQFVGGVIAVPSAVSLVWFAIFGGAAISVQDGGTNIAGRDGVEAQLFGLLREYPIAAVTSVLVIVLVAIFFVSGADAASIVMGTLTQRGSQHPARTVVVFWGVLTGAVAAIMLLLGGEDALNGLQTLTILAAFPFAIVIVALCVSLARDLRSDPLVKREENALKALEKAAADLQRARQRARGT
jgi:choline/carnitine/betaine transport